MFVEKLKQENAITIPTLIITIILLLILASIGIAAITSSREILEKATTSVSAHKYEEIREKVNLKLMNLNIEKLSENQTITLEDVLKLKDTDEDIVDAYETNGNVVLLIDKYECTINEDLDVQSITIYNPSQIKKVDRELTYCSFDR